MCNGLLFSFEKEILKHSIAWMNIGDIMLSKVNQAQKHKYYDSIYIMCLEWSNSQKQKVKPWSPEGGEGKNGE